MIFTALSPNTQKDDFFLAVRTLFSDKEYFNGPFSEKLENWFGKFFDSKYVITYESARTALFFTLSNLGVSKGDEVIVQSFTCVAAINPIKWLGANPVYVDIDPETFNMDVNDLDDKITPKTKAILLQHTFGYPAEVEEIKKIARANDIYLIEDCAHTIGTKYKGRLLGKFGDAAVFSLGRDKAISASFGGVVITDNSKLGKKLNKGSDFLEYPEKSWVGSQILYTIIIFLTRKFYNFFGIGKVIHSLAFKLRIVNKATTDEEKRSGTLPNHAKSRIPNAFAKLALNQLEKLEFMNRKRVKIVRKYKKFLEKEKINSITQPSWELNDELFPLRYPILTREKKALIEYSKKRGLILGDWYDSPVAPKEVNLFQAGYKQGSCPKAEKVCREIVNLPTHINMSSKDINKVLEILLEF